MKKLICIVLLVCVAASCSHAEPLSFGIDSDMDFNQVIEILSGFFGEMEPLQGMTGTFYADVSGKRLLDFDITSAGARDSSIGWFYSLNMEEKEPESLLPHLRALVSAISEDHGTYEEIPSLSTIDLAGNEVKHSILDDPDAFLSEQVISFVWNRADISVIGNSININFYQLGREERNAARKEAAP